MRRDELAAALAQVLSYQNGLPWTVWPAIPSGGAVTPPCAIITPAQDWLNPSDAWDDRLLAAWTVHLVSDGVDGDAEQRLTEALTRALGAIGDLDGATIRWPITAPALVDLGGATYLALALTLDLVIT